jgi:hypothetical protein
MRLQALCLVPLIVCGMGGIPVRTWAQTPAANETNLKLARLYATAKFISWPDEAVASTKPFVIGVIEPDPFGAGLNKLAERKLKERPIRVVRMKSAQDYEACHLLFIPAEAPPALVRELLQRTANQPVLVWRDEPDTPATGVGCTFVRQGDTIVIEADPAELKRRQLIPDGRLLSLNLVRVVKTGP